MTECRFASSCSVLMDFLTDEPALAWVYRERYCHGDRHQCSRYRIAAAGGEVPRFLLPNERHPVEPDRPTPSVRDVTP